MGFYKTDENTDGNKQRRPQGLGAAKWIGTIVLSAIVGSGATLVAFPAIQNSGLLATMAPASSSDNVQPLSSNVNVSVNDGITTAVKKVEPAVMGVVNYSQVSDFFSQQSKLQASGVGTGVLVSKDGQYGYLVTNNHVVEGAAKVEVVLTSGKHVQATVVGTDPYTDLAVLKVPISNVRNITPAEFGNSDDLQAGEPAIAIGTPMGLDFADSVTAGIISATKRIMPVEDPQVQQTLDYQAVIQTDAAINPGNSGGPLLNIAGQVIGINSSKIVAQNFEGMGFAIPANEVKNIANQIMKSGHAIHPALGIEGYSLSSLPEQWWPNVPVDYGVWVKAVTSQDAKSAGLKAQDVIVGIDGHSVKSMADLRTYLFQVSPNQTVTLNVYRGSSQVALKVKLTAMDSTPSSVAPTSQNGAGSSDSLDPFASPGGSGSIN